MRVRTVPANGTFADTDIFDKREILKVLTAFKSGDFKARMPVERTGLSGKIADALNEIIELNQKMTMEFARISDAVGREGKINERAFLGGYGGGWAACVESLNALIGLVVQPSTEVARVIGAVAKGDLTQTMPLEVDGRQLKGEFLRTARVVNTMVEQLNGFASEVIRVAREVGTEGKLGGQAQVRGVSGTWKDLTEIGELHGLATSPTRSEISPRSPRPWLMATFRRASPWTRGARFWS